MTTELLTAAAAVFLAAAIVSNVVIDRMRAERSRQKLFLEACLAKALQDRRDSVRIPSATLAGIFRLDGRTLRAATDFNGKGGKHPATVTPARRRKMGAKP